MKAKQDDVLVAAFPQRGEQNSTSDQASPTPNSQLIDIGGVSAWLALRFAGSSEVRPSRPVLGTAIHSRSLDRNRFPRRLAAQTAR